MKTHQIQHNASWARATTTAMSARSASDEEALQRALEVSRLAPAPTEALFGITVTDAVPGSLRVEQQIHSAGDANRPWGWIGPLADLTAGRSVLTHLTEDQSCRTVNLRLDFGGRLPRAGERVTAHGRVIDLSDDSALAASTLVGSDGTILAHCVGRFMIVSGAHAGSPKDELPQPTTEALEHLLGLRVLEKRPTALVLGVAPDRRLANSFDIMHGGVQFALADVSLRHVIAETTSLEAKHLDLAVSYHRPVHVSGETMTICAFVERQGRRIIVARIRARDSLDRLLFSAEGTFATSPSARDQGQ
ncbi:PaaI family thioesterase [Arthrobacter globiformis]|uniref:PaaI family thioesterase n=1 Tax=Arthrobacter globiformis TaxID=1665 RepID=UPI00278FCA4B|nr:PaaI family thioesterase [Arthrobacter globiformis]MDQ0616660.1 uncharacterized protein (TIGR00369 family) [Arthrobacter globiformis]